MAAGIARGLISGCNRSAVGVLVVMAVSCFRSNSGSTCQQAPAVQRWALGIEEMNMITVNNGLAWSLLGLVLLLALLGALRWDVLKLWWRGLFTPRQEPHLSLQPHLTDRHRHLHRHPHETDPSSSA
jgi:hypothetical protein